MDTWKRLRQRVFFLFMGIFITMVMAMVVLFHESDIVIPKPVRRANLPPKICPIVVSDQTITPLKNTKHLLVSAFQDQRDEEYDIRIISILKRDSIESLLCLFCCGGRFFNTSPAEIQQNPHNFGFPYVASDILCQFPPNCNSTHVSLLTQTDYENVSASVWLPIKNREAGGKREIKMQFNLTVCISNLFEFNNVLQYAQTLELYKLLGVNRVVIYNTSCGPELQRLLQHYNQEGFVEMVSWPIDRYLTPSYGWLFSLSGGDVHYFGQLATLNECIYRSMDRSRYVLLHDIDEIIMPYGYDTLTPLMEVFQEESPNAAVFYVQSHNYPIAPFDGREQRSQPHWRGVPGINLLERIYKWKLVPSPEVNPIKIIVRPRSVVQTSVHMVLNHYGTIFNIPADVCHVIHARLSPQTEQSLDDVLLDTRLWDFKDVLIPNVNSALRKAGML
ncbi:uncharacterized protein V6R79_000112 [Siganus canaliculatus]